MDPVREWIRTHVPGLDGRGILITGVNDGIGTDFADLTSLDDEAEHRHAAHAGVS